VGADGQATNVQLVDRVDNGNRGTGGTREAPYLFGLTGADGLQALGGSTLHLAGPPTYALLGGQITDLHSLFPGGVTRIAFDQGLLAGAVPLPSAQLLALSSFSARFGGALPRRRAR